MSEKFDICNVSIALAEYEDCPDIAELISKEFGDYYYYFNRSINDIHIKNHFKNTILCVAKHNDKVIGYARCRFNEASIDCPKGWYLMGLIVRDDYKRLGVGKKLTDFRLKWIYEQYSKCYYIVAEDNIASIKLHDKYNAQLLDSKKSIFSIQFNNQNCLLYQLENSL